MYQTFLTAGCHAFSLRHSPRSTLHRVKVTCRIRCLTTQVQARDSVSGIWYIPKASSTDHNTVICMLPKLLPSKRQDLTTAVFFATPSVAKWFAPGHEFLSAAINQIYRPLISEAPPTSIVAIVDALPGPSLVSEHTNSYKTPVHGAEGLALCLLPGSESILPSNKSTSELPLVRFCSHPSTLSNGAQTVASVSIQIANTLFVNGSKSTLYRQNWHAVGTALGSKWDIHGPTEPLDGLTIPINRAASHLMVFDTRLQIMTKPRKVVASMGNVVREVEDDNGGTIKASTELETMVPAFLKRKQDEFGAGRVEVYALLMPPDSIVNVDHHGLEEQHNARVMEEQPDDISDEHSKVQRLIYWALWRRGRLHKVTGGGGGWGKKAGLLSLDTSTNFEGTSQFEISMFPTLDDEEGVEIGRPSSTEEAIPLGWTIQFLAVFVGPEKDPYENFHEHSDRPVNWTAERWSWNEKRTSIIVGTTDPKDESTSSYSTHSGDGDKVIAVPSSFGLLSPGGICLSIEQLPSRQDTPADPNVSGGTIHQFRVDAPHTVFHASCKALQKPKDYTEKDETFDFESTNESSTGSLGPLMQDAIRASRKSEFRKLQFQPRPKFEIPANKARKYQSPVKWKSLNNPDRPLRITKHKSG